MDPAERTRIRKVDEEGGVRNSGPSQRVKDEERKANLRLFTWEC